MPATTRATLDGLDWTVLGIYLVATFAIAIVVRVGQRNLTDYFLAGRSMPFVIVAMSLFATLFSTLSFVGVPGEAYRNGMLTSLTSLGYAVCTPLAVWLFLRFFFHTGETFTAYEYLERRFNRSARLLGGMTFLGARALFGATVIFAAGRLLETLVGWEPTTVILAIGAFSVAYTTIGGMRAAMLTDVVQTVIIFIALAAVIGRLLWLIELDGGAFLEYVAEHDRGFDRMVSAEFYSFDPHVRYTFWVFLFISLTMPLQHYGTDQLVVQRFLASRNYRDARRAILLKTLITPLFIFTLFGVGLLLFYYYSTVGTKPEHITADQVMGYFIVTQLPSPLPGLVAAGLIAALMSTIDSTVGSLSTVTCIDLLEKQGWLPQNERTRMRIGRSLTVAWGTLLIAMAVWLARASKSTTAMVYEMASVLASLWGVLLVVMLAGVLTRRATAPAATAALAVGMSINLTLPLYLYLGVAHEARISFAWVGLPGTLATLVTIVLVSLVTSPPRRNMAKLVLGGSRGQNEPN